MWPRSVPTGINTSSIVLPAGQWLVLCSVSSAKQSKSCWQLSHVKMDSSSRSSSWSRSSRSSCSSCSPSWLAAGLWPSLGADSFPEAGTSVQTRNLVKGGASYLKKRKKRMFHIFKGSGSTRQCGTSLFVLAERSNVHVLLTDRQCERGPVEACVGPIHTAPLCLHFHTLLSHYNTEDPTGLTLKTLVGGKERGGIKRFKALERT